MIETYLAELRAALAGADPALVQDALYDAEEYFRAEAAGIDVGTEAGAAQWASIVEAYGSPQEVAQAYRDADATIARVMKPPTAPKGRGPLGAFFGALVDPYAYGSLFYLLLSLVTGVAYFTLITVLLPLGLGLLPVGVGVLVLLLLFAIVRAVSLLEGRIVEALLGVRMPRRPRGLFRQGDVVDRVKHWFTDGRTWTSILYMGLQLVLGTVYFSLAVGMLALSASGVIYPVAQLFTDYPLVQFGGYGYLLQPWATPLVMALGVLGFVLTLNVSRLLGRAHAWYAKSMLVGRFSE